MTEELGNTPDRDQQVANAQFTILDKLNSMPSNIGRLDKAVELDRQDDGSTSPTAAEAMRGIDFSEFLRDGIVLDAIHRKLSGDRSHQPEPISSPEELLSKATAEQLKTPTDKE